ncbi:MAG TPA: hypothetical protein VFZ53_25955 [Polyangiaceae bacterium]
MTRSDHLVPWARSEDTDETLRRLVRAGRNDGPSAESLRAAAPAIAALLAASATTTIATAIAGSGTAGAAAFGAKNSLASVLLIKWFGYGVLAGGAVVAAANVPRLTGPPPEAGVRPVVSVPRRSPEPPVPRPRRVPAEPVAAVASSAASSRASSRLDLAREIVLLDRARAALAAGAPRRALEALDELSRLSARALAPEATVLRVRALLAVGSQGQARAVVEDFARRAPGSPQVGVLRGLLEPEDAVPPVEIDAGSGAEAK